MKTLMEPFDVLSRQEVAAALDNLSQASVAVLGDFCLDVYWTIDRSASEISVETGICTEPIRQQRYSPGGAGNVVANLLTLGVHRVYPVGILGDDPFGRELLRLFDHPHLDSRGLIVQDESWATHAYVKPYVGDEELNRIDHGNFNRLDTKTENLLFERLEKVLERVSVVLVNHQVIGSLHDSPTFRRRLATMISRYPDVCFIVDSRGYHESYTTAVHKLNDREVLRANGVDLAVEEVALSDLVQNVAELYRRWQAPLVVTRGERGCLVYTGEIVQQIFGIQLPGRADPVGAGDTFVSTLAAIVSTGTNLAAAAFVANIAAAVTAQKLFQTGTAQPSEILELATSAEYAFHPELADSLHRAKILDGSEIEIVAEPPAALDLRYAIFDHDGTISTLREGWESIMLPMMLRAVLGDAGALIDETRLLQVKSRVQQFIERTTGIQTITQMHGLVELVAEFGFVPREQIHTPAEYKAVYNSELKALVDRRLEKLSRGELDVADFTVKGAVPFLRALQRLGIRVYLASGTDEEDVKFEAEKLGYSDVFNGGIYGSVGVVDRDAKKIVIERILREVDGAYERLVTFGDGPVEMRESSRHGALSVGVASDELRRFGLSADKRRRLIRSGAHLIVPDFSQWQTLWHLLRLPPH